MIALRYRSANCGRRLPDLRACDAARFAIRKYSRRGWNTLDAGTIVQPSPFRLQTLARPSQSRHPFLAYVENELPDSESGESIVLEEAINDTSLHRPSLSRLAARLGCRQTTLARRFPKQIRIIKARHKSYCAIRKEVGANLFRSLVHRRAAQIRRSARTCR